MIYPFKKHLQLVHGIDESFVPAFVGTERMGDRVDNIDTLYDGYHSIV